MDSSIFIVNNYLWPNFRAVLAGIAAISGANVANSIVDTTLLKSAKLELRRPVGGTPPPETTDSAETACPYQPDAPARVFRIV